MTYDVGGLARLKVFFTDANGAAADPTTITLRVRHGSTTTTYNDATKDATGEYHRDVTIDAAGVWFYRWIGTGGAVTAAKESRFFVRTSNAT